MLILPLDPDVIPIIIRVVLRARMSAMDSYRSREVGVFKSGPVVLPCTVVALFMFAAEQVFGDEELVVPNDDVGFVKVVVVVVGRFRVVEVAVGAEGY